MTDTHQLKTLYEKEAYQEVIDTFQDQSESFVRREDYLWGYLYQLKALLQMSDIDGLQSVLGEEDLEGEIVNFPHLAAEYYFVTGTFHYAKGDLQKSILILEKALGKLLKVVDDDETQQLQGDILNRLGTAYGSVGNYLDAITTLQKALEIRKVGGDKNRIGGSLYNLGTMSFQKGDYDAAISLLSDTYEVFEETGNLLGVAYCKMEIGGIYQYKGQLQAALDHFQDAHELYSDHGSETQVAWSLTDLGNIYQRLGNIGKSLEYYEMAVPIYERSNDKRVYGNHLRAMAISHRLSGSLAKSIDLNREALRLYQEIDNQNYCGRAHYQLAQDYLQLEKYLDAEKHLKEAESIFDQEEHSDYQIRVYFEFVKLHNETDDQQLLQRYVTKLEALNESYSSDLFDQILNVSSAIRLQRTNRIKGIYLAIEKLQSTLKNKVVDIQITSFAALLLLKAYLREYELVQNPDCLVDLQDYSETLISIARTNNLLLLEIKILVIMAKIHALSFDFSISRDFLQAAEQLATDKGLGKIVNFIHKENKELDDLQNSYTTLFSESDDPDEVIETHNLTSFIDNLLGNQYQLKSTISEEPILVNLIAQNGTSLYEKKFQSIDIDPQLLAGFVSAISAFSEETFAGTSLEKIILGDIMVGIYKMYNMKICYLYRGSKISANNRISKLISSINQIPQMREQLQARSEFEMPIDEENEIMSAIQQVFG